MTDKELKKLSRLELLELLLQASNENKKLKKQIDRLSVENKTTQNIENLHEITRQVENTLKYANGLTDSLKTTLSEVVPLKNNADNANAKKNETSVKSGSLSDVEIYRRMLYFFANNDDKLNVFPADIENDVRARIKSILERRKSN